ncbi:IclR family transcriptional regulator [Streptomyces blattellae]|uniref:IclR family transcriptional regulator n=1 Tax=Streptomyces blattellae TaxID=2569855 RepID=UPI0018ACC6E9|nr:IclR family transcriptional regulator [Streptomyces blattellae]
MSTDTIAVLDRALSVLRVLALRPEGYSLPELVEELGLPKSTVRRFLVTLAGHGFADYDEERQRYTLGVLILGLAAGIAQQNVIAVTLHPALERLQRETQETASLWIRVRFSALCLSSIESPQFVRTVSPLGRSIPLYASAHSKVLLTQLSDAELEEYLAATDLQALTPQTITDPAAVRQEIREAREKGYAVSIGEVNDDAVGIAAPVTDQTGRIIACLSITAPAHRVDDRRLPTLISSVLDAAAMGTARITGSRHPASATTPRSSSGRP